MDAMILSTTGFARLLLGALFLANLAMWVFRYSGAGQLGTILALVAIVAAWFAQEQYTHAAAHQEMEPTYSDLLRTGNVGRWLSVGAAASAFLCILFG
jgi:hypothetical protein